jgi:hypothetical protein
MGGECRESWKGEKNGGRECCEMEEGHRGGERRRGNSVEHRKLCEELRCLRDGNKEVVIEIGF